MSKILIVEDDFDIRNILTIYLQRSYEVVSFSNGEDALENFSIENPDLVILDIGLPGINGYEVCEKVREVDGEVPIIFISASREEQDRLLGFKLGANDYFTKPFDITKLLVCIEKHLENHTHNV